MINSYEFDHQDDLERLHDCLLRNLPTQYQYVNRDVALSAIKNPTAEEIFRILKSLRFTPNRLCMESYVKAKRILSEEHPRVVFLSLCLGVFLSFDCSYYFIHDIPKENVFTYVYPSQIVAMTMLDYFAAALRQKLSIDSSKIWRPEELEFTHSRPFSVIYFVTRVLRLAKYYVRTFELRPISNIPSKSRLENAENEDSDSSDFTLADSFSYDSSEEIEQIEIEQREELIEDSIDSVEQIEIEDSEESIEDMIDGIAKIELREMNEDTIEEFEKNEIEVLSEDTVDEIEGFPVEGEDVDSEDIDDCYFGEFFCEFFEADSLYMAEKFSDKIVKKRIKRELSKSITSHGGIF